MDSKKYITTEVGLIIILAVSFVVMSTIALYSILTLSYIIDLLA